MDRYMIGTRPNLGKDDAHYSSIIVRGFAGERNTKFALVARTRRTNDSILYTKHKMLCTVSHRAGAPH